MATTKKAARKTAARIKGNTSEILYAVFGYLTARPVPLILSAKHGAAPVAELIGEIIKANGLPPTNTKTKPPRLNVTDLMETLTNVPASAKVNENTQASPDSGRKKLPTAAEASETVFLEMQRNMDLQEQNKFIGLLINRMKEGRLEFMAMREKGLERVQDELERSRKIYEEFLQIVKNS